MGDEKPTAPLKTAPSPTSPKKDEGKLKRNRYLLCGCILSACLFIVILAVILNSAFVKHYFNRTANADNFPIPSPVLTTFIPTPDPQSYEDYETSQTCSQVSTPDSEMYPVSPLSPGLQQNTDTHYYAIYGSTAEDLRAQMYDCGPKVEGGSYDALCNNRASWIYEYDMVPGGGCRVANLAVGLQVDLYYPKWEMPASYQNGLLERWQTFISRIEFHENAHKDIALQGAQAILESIQNLPASASCNDLEITVNNTGQAVWQEYVARNKAYDDETQHGLTQGTQFP